MGSRIPVDCHKQLAILTLAMCVLAVACVSAPELRNTQPVGGARPEGGSLTVGLNSQLGTLDPNRVSSGWEISTSHQIYDYLVAVDSNEPRIKPWLAESWSVSTDGKTYTLKLRPGVKFHDGTPFDANAAKRNFERLSVPYGPVRDIATNLANVRAAGDATLVVDLKTPSPAFMSGLAYAPMISPAASEQWGNDYGQHPVGTGPFKVKEWIAQDHLILERNPDYAWAPANSTNSGRAYLDSVTLKFIVDPPARLVSLESGDTQMITFVPLQDVSRLAADQRFKITRAGGQVGGPLTFFMNVNAGPLVDPLVRAAVQSALDRAELIQTGGHGQPIPAAGLLNSSMRCYSSSFANVFPHDLTHARQLLDAAGWVPGPDGMRQKEGVSLRFELVHFPDYANLAATIQAELREAGIDLSLRMVDVPAGGALIGKGQASSFLVAAGTLNDPSFLSTSFHTRAIGASAYGPTLTRDPETDRLLDQALTEADPTTQCQLYDQFQQRYLQTAAAYPIWETFAPLAMRSNIDGIRLLPNVGIMPQFQEVYFHSQEVEH